MLPSPERRDPGRVRAMFGAIARTYDLLNRLLSLGFDVRWRRLAVREIALGGSGRILDLCGGTGDLSVAAARAEPGASVVCCDFAHPMLSRAAPK
ncbi:MAG TPA: class I SAM-dependent methyltransferase, partial [Candidatus Polarisedimenticolaceae bacterium]